MVCGLQIENQYFKQPFFSEQSATNLGREKEFRIWSPFDGAMLDLRWNSVDMYKKRKEQRTLFCKVSLKKSKAQGIS
jgi:hypothetical protein